MFLIFHYMALIYRCNAGVTTLDNTSDWLFPEEIPSEYISDLTEELQESWSGRVNDYWSTPVAN